MSKCYIFLSKSYIFLSEFVKHILSIKKPLPDRRQRNFAILKKLAAFPFGGPAIIARYLF